MVNQFSFQFSVKKCDYLRQKLLQVGARAFGPCDLTTSQCGGHYVQTGIAAVVIRIMSHAQAGTVEVAHGTVRMKRGRIEIKYKSHNIACK